MLHVFPDIQNTCTLKRWSKYTRLVYNSAGKATIQTLSQRGYTF